MYSNLTRTGPAVPWAAVQEAETVPSGKLGLGQPKAANGPRLPNKRNKFAHCIAVTMEIKYTRHGNFKYDFFS